VRWAYQSAQSWLGMPTRCTSTARRAAELEAGVELLRRLLSLLPRLQLVMLLGGSAQDSWRRLVRRHPDVAAGLEVVPTYHTSSQALIGPPDIRATRMAALKAAFAQTARVLQ